MITICAKFIKNADSIISAGVFAIHIHFHLIEGPFWDFGDLFNLERCKLAFR